MPKKYEEFLSEQLLSRLHSDVVDFKNKNKHINSKKIP